MGPHTKKQAILFCCRNTCLLTTTNTYDYEFNFYTCLRGKKDTKASLRLNRAGKDIDFTVVRKAFRLKGKKNVAVITKRQTSHFLGGYLTEVDFRSSDSLF
jgi:hypothetical protein